MAKRKEEIKEATEEVASNKVYKVVNGFTDKYDLTKHYKVDDNFASDDDERIKDLLNRNLIVEQ